MAEVEVDANDVPTAAQLVWWLVARGPGGRSPRRSVAVVVAAEPTCCAGSCTFAFPTDELSVASVAMNGVSEGVPCPDPGNCDVGPTEQLDAVNLKVCAGPGTVYDAAVILDAFALEAARQGSTSEDGRNGC